MLPFKSLQATYKTSGARDDVGERLRDLRRLCLNAKFFLWKHGGTDSFNKSLKLTERNKK